MSDQNKDKKLSIKRSNLGNIAGGAGDDTSGRKKEKDKGSHEKEKASHGG